MIKGLFLIKAGLRLLGYSALGWTSIAVTHTAHWQDLLFLSALLLILSELVGIAEKMGARRVD